MDSKYLVEVFSQDGSSEPMVALECDNRPAADRLVNYYDRLCSECIVLSELRPDGTKVQIEA